MNPDHFCMGCMTERENPEGPCPHCGFDEQASPPAPHQLPPRTILNGKYLVGRILGEGGFGITYLGWDLNLDLKIAIKEYYPAGFVTREITGTNSITPFTGDSLEFFTRGRDKFINEAKTLAKFYTLPGIVSVKDFFLENGTAYIVMEYLDGITLKQHLAQKGGKLPAAEVFALMEPLVKSLTEVHRAGLIHRDISPDNIMLTKDGSVKLLDFGAAREISASGEKSNTVNIKTGYAPEEQYRTHGVQGPWTDIYALSATIYKCITGVTPDESLERLREDRLVPPSALGIALSPGQEAALMKGLAVLQKNRFQDLEEFSAALHSAAPVSYAPHPTPTDKTVPLYPSPERSASTGTAGTSEIPASTGFTYGGGTAEATAQQSKKHRRVILLAALGAIVVLFIIVSALAAPAAQSSLPADAESSSSDSGIISSAPEASHTVGTAPAAGKFQNGAYQDGSIRFSFPKDWVPSVGKNGSPSVTGLKDGVKYQLTVLDESADTGEDIFADMLGKIPVVSTTKAPSSINNEKVGNFSAAVITCLYKGDDGSSNSITMYGITDGKTRIIIDTRCFGLDDNMDPDARYSDDVYKDIINTLEFVGSGENSSEAVSSDASASSGDSVVPDSSEAEPDSSEAEPDSSAPSSKPRSSDLDMYLPSIQARYQSGQIKEVAANKTVTTENHFSYTVKSGTMVSGKGTSQDYLKVTIDLGVAPDQDTAMSMGDCDFVLLARNSSTDKSQICTADYLMEGGKKVSFPFLVGQTETMDLMFPIPKGTHQANFVCTNFLYDKAAGPLYVTYSN